MNEKAKLSSKYQIVIPKAARKYAQLQAGDELLVTGIDGNLILLKKPDSYTEYTAGLHQDIWKGIDPLKHVKSLRKKWSKRTK